MGTSRPGAGRVRQLHPDRAADFAIGSKRHPGSVVVYPPLRHFYSWDIRSSRGCCSAWMSPTPRAGSSWPPRDHHRAAPILEEDGFTFDLELLAVARRLGYTRVVELPVEIRETFLVHGLSEGGLADARRYRTPDLADPDCTPLRPSMPCRGVLAASPASEAPLAGAPDGSRPKPKRRARASPRPVDASRQGLEICGSIAETLRFGAGSSRACGRARVDDTVRAQDRGDLERVEALVEVDGRSDSAPLGLIGDEGPCEARPLGQRRRSPRSVPRATLPTRGHRCRGTSPPARRAGTRWPEPVCCTSVQAGVGDRDLQVKKAGTNRPVAESRSTLLMRRGQQSEPEPAFGPKHFCGAK